MPMAGSTSEVSVSSATRKLILNTLPKYVVAGSVFTFTGSYVADSTGIPNALVKIKYCLYDKPYICYDVGTATTGSNGSFSYNWTVPYSMACKKYLFYAVDESVDVSSSMQEMAVAYETRIRITSAPTAVVPGSPFQVSGVLEKKDSATTWSPVPSGIIDVYVDGAKIASITTGSDGTFTVTITITTSGSHIIRFVYAGTI